MRHPRRGRSYFDRNLELAGTMALRCMRCSSIASLGDLTARAPGIRGPIGRIRQLGFPGPSCGLTMLSTGWRRARALTNPSPMRHAATYSAHHERSCWHADRPAVGAAGKNRRCFSEAPSRRNAAMLASSVTRLLIIDGPLLLTSPAFRSLRFCRGALVAINPRMIPSSWRFSREQPAIVPHFPSFLGCRFCRLRFPSGSARLRFESGKSYRPCPTPRS